MRAARLNLRKAPALDSEIAKNLSYYILTKGYLLACCRDIPSQILI